MSLNAIFAAIRATPKKTEKRAILAQHKDNLLLAQFLRAVYDPRLNYYITKLPKPADSVTDPREFSEDDIADMVEGIAGRQYTGKNAKSVIAAKLAALNDDGKELLGYLIARDVKAGMAENSILSVWPDLFYIPPYQRCASQTAELKARFAGMGHFYVQTKSDGQFCYAINRKFGALDPERQAMSRAGSLYPEWLANHITYGLPEGYVAMGELLVVREGKTLDRKTGNGILNSVLSSDGSKFLQTDSIKFLAWDMVTEAEFDGGESDRDYELRYHDLQNLTSLERVPSWIVGTIKEANHIHKEHLDRKEEGTVWKSPKMKWRDCSSGDKDMMKAKRVFEADYIVTGFYEGTGKAAGMLGGLDLATSDNLIQFSVGSGFSDELRKAMWAVRDTLPGKVVAAEGNGIETSKSKPGVESVFLPIFIEVRVDKKEADSRARVWEQFNAAGEKE